MTFFRRILLPLLLISKASAAPLWAAEFSLTPNHPQGCSFEMSGQIAPGDLAALKAFAKSRLASLKLSPTYREDDPVLGKRPLVCLNSPGGSLAEAVRMAQFLRGPEEAIAAEAILPLRNLGTVVAKGARCESACAILFMAGQTSEGDHGRWPDRYLHEDGRLGFHAPSLGVAKGNYSEAAVDRAFQVAVSAIAQLMENAPDWGIPPALLTQMLTTAPEDMAYVSGVAALQEFGITPLADAAIELPDRLAKGHVRHLCYLALNGATLDSGREPAVARLSEGLPRYDEIHQSFEESGGVVRFVFGIFDEGGFICDGEVGAAAPFAGQVTVDEFNDSPQRLQIEPWMLAVDREPTALRATKTCAASDGSGYREAPCEVAFSRLQRPDYEEDLDWIVKGELGLWVISARGSQMTINGDAGEAHYDFPDAYWDRGGDCVSAGGKVFCLLD